MEEQAMRFNEGKPELAYLLSFEGGIEAAFSYTGYEDALGLLGEWYRGKESIGFAVQEILSLLRSDWPELLALTSMKGAKKYARGNYLLGRGYHDTCNSLLRHMYAKYVRGEEIDPELGIDHDGPIAWGLLFLKHCVLTMPQFDDRLRAPKAVVV